MDIPVYKEGEAPLRAYFLQRKTKETDITASLDLDGREV